MASIQIFHTEAGPLGELLEAAMARSPTIARSHGSVSIRSRSRSRAGTTSCGQAEQAIGRDR
jgi:hypothetical protein